MRVAGTKSLASCFLFLGCVVLAVIVLFVYIAVGCTEGQSCGMEEPASSSMSAGSSIRKVTPDEALSMMTSDRVLILDVRTQEEYDESHIPNAKLFTLGEIDQGLAAAVIPKKDVRVIVYCQTGVRSEEAAQKLVEMGYTKVVDMGGISTWPYETINVSPEGDVSTVKNDELPVGVKVVCGQTRSLPEIDAEE